MITVNSVDVIDIKYPKNGDAVTKPIPWNVIIKHDMNASLVCNGMSTSRNESTTA